jgi:hypothetical protein
MSASRESSLREKLKTRYSKLQSSLKDKITKKVWWLRRLRLKIKKWWS